MTKEQVLKKITSSNKSDWEEIFIFFNELNNIPSEFKPHLIDNEEKVLLCYKYNMTYLIVESKTNNLLLKEKIARCKISNFRKNNILNEINKLIKYYFNIDILIKDIFFYKKELDKVEKWKKDKTNQYSLPGVSQETVYHYLESLETLKKLREIDIPIQEDLLLKILVI